MKRAPKTENDVKALVKTWFDQHFAWHYAPLQNGMGVHGIPDRIGCVPITVTQAMVGKRVGLFIAVECKAPHRINEKDGGVTKHQFDNICAICEAAGVAFVAYDDELLTDPAELIGG